MPENPPTIVSARHRRAHLADNEIATWLDRFERNLKEQDLSRRDVCALVADVVKGEIERRWVGEARFADMLLWLVCRGDAGVISRISNGAPSWDFQVDVYPWGEVDVWISGGPEMSSVPNRGSAERTELQLSTEQETKKRACQTRLSFAHAKMLCGCPQ